AIGFDKDTTLDVGKLQSLGISHCNLKGLVGNAFVGQIISGLVLCVLTHWPSKDDKSVTSHLRAFDEGHDSNDNYNERDDGDDHSAFLADWGAVVEGLWSVRLCTAGLCATRVDHGEAVVGQLVSTQETVNSAQFMCRGRHVSSIQVLPH
ncbi:MAG: hypothetical protein ACKPKO_11595, partial [Candidatus Fonsibacter sp.]